MEKSLGSDTTLELGYLGSHGVHLQRAHLINNAPPGPGAIGPRRPFKTISFVPDTTLPPGVDVVSTTFRVSTINLLENTAQSWYDAGYVNVRRRYAHGFSLLANYTWSKNLSDAPDFRSPMFESSIPQNNNDLDAEKGPACDVRHRFALSAVYNVPGSKGSNLIRSEPITPARLSSDRIPKTPAYGSTAPRLRRRLSLETSTWPGLTGRSASS